MSGLCCSIIDWSWAVLILLFILLQFISIALSLGLEGGFFFEALSGDDVFAGFGPKGKVSGLDGVISSLRMEKVFDSLISDDANEGV